MAGKDEWHGGQGELMERLGSDERGRVCARCSAWSRPEDKRRPGRCADGYSAWPHDSCAKWRSEGR